MPFTVPGYCPNFDTINALSTRWMGKLVGNGGPALLLLPVLLVLALSPRAIPAAVLEQTRIAACAAITMFLFAADLHRFVVNFQDFVDPSGHLLVYGCGVLGALPLVTWTIARLVEGRRGSSGSDIAPSSSASIASVEQSQQQAEEDAEEGLAAAVGVLVLLVAAFIVYFSAVTAAFFHTTADTTIPAVFIMVAAGLLQAGFFVDSTLSDAVLPWWIISKLCVLVIAASRFLPPLATALQAAGVPFDTRFGQPLPPISAKTMGITFAYDVGLVCLYLFWLRGAEQRRPKAE